MMGRLLNAVDRMPESARRGAVILVPLLLFGMLVAAFALAPAEGGGSASRSRASDRLLPATTGNVPAPAAPVPPSLPQYAVPRARASGPVVDPDRPLPNAKPVREMLATARSFTNAYLLYEIGRLPRPVRRAIDRTCSAAFARYLLARPAHLGGLYAAHPRDVENDGVVSVSFVGGTSVEVSYVADQNSADTGAFLVKLARARGRWLVTGVGL